MKGKFAFRDRLNIKPNPYDLGVISNYSTIFEGQSWTWWWPSEIIPRADGTRFPMRPPVSSDQFIKLAPEVR